MNKEICIKMIVIGLISFFICPALLLAGAQILRGAGVPIPQVNYWGMIMLYICWNIVLYPLKVKIKED